MSLLERYVAFMSPTSNRPRRQDLAAGATDQGPKALANSAAPINTGTRNTLGYIILGLLGSRPMSGYDIKRAFDRSLATYWNAGHSQIYTTLKALAGRRLVTSELVYQEGRPNRRVYRLTPTGRDQLDLWLAEPVPPRYTKDEFLTKLFFCGQTSDQAALLHLEAHLVALHAQLADMEQALRDYGNRPTRRPRLLEYQMLVRDYKQAILQADLEITEGALARIQARCQADTPG